ncbi:MAG TPA: c-type cytochrome [Thermoleophilaceae bacterium]
MAALVAALAVGCGAGTKPEVVSGASVSQGHDLIAHFGCGACHQIGGVSGADGHVGPPLKNFKKSIPFIVGKLPNTPANAARWIENPQAILPQGIMPNLGVTPQQARDIAAYLYTQ